MRCINDVKPLARFDFDFDLFDNRGIGFLSKEPLLKAVVSCLRSCKNPCGLPENW